MNKYNSGDLIKAINNDHTMLIVGIEQNQNYIVYSLKNKQVTGNVHKETFEKLTMLAAEKNET